MTTASEINRSYMIKRLPKEATVEELRALVQELNMILTEIGEVQNDLNSRVTALE